MNMKTFEGLIPLFTAIISAAALLVGYVYQKHMETDAGIRKNRQEIYSRLITNITKRNEMQWRIENSPDWKKAKNEQEQYQMILKDAEMSKNWHDRTEVVAFLFLYGTDDAINAYAKWVSEGSNVENIGKLILAFRKSIYPETHTTADDANLTIWNIHKPLPAKQQ